MNSKKIAVFVEGLTEQIFVREFPNVWFGYDSNILGTLYNALTPERIEDNTGIDITKDPEKSFFHPYVTLCKILDLKGITYKKHESDVSSLISKLGRTDYESLLSSGNCHSFKTFADTLLPPAKISHA